MPEGTLAVTGTRHPSMTVKPNAVFLLTEDLAVIDSILVPTGQLGAYDAVLSPDETTLNVLAPPYLTALDVTTRSVIGTTPSMAASYLWLGVDSLIYEVDGGQGADAQTPGFFVEHHNTLRARRALSLLDAGVSGRLPIARAVAVNRTGMTAYVLTGSLPMATAAEKAAVARYDLSSGNHSRTLSLDQHGTAFRIFMLPER